MTTEWINKYRPKKGKKVASKDSVVTKMIKAQDKSIKKAIKAETDAVKKVRL